MTEVANLELQTACFIVGSMLLKPEFSLDSQEDIDEIAQKALKLAKALIKESKNKQRDTR